MIRGALLITWGWIVLWSVISGRLDLLLRGVFHGLVGISGAALLLAGVVLLIRQRGRYERLPWAWWSSAAIALLVLLVPPNPSFSDLAESRPQGLPEPPELAFVLPPEQRTLTEWVRLLRSQQDPDLVDGNPVNISGFVWTQQSGPPLIARLTVRCCLADATPAGLPVHWPEGFIPNTNQWLSIQGEMVVTTLDEKRVAVVMPKAITSISRPKRPLEP